MASNPWDGVDRTAYSPVRRRTFTPYTAQDQEAEESTPSLTDTTMVTQQQTQQDGTFDTYAKSVGYDGMPHIDRLKAWEKYRNEILPGVAQQNGYRADVAQKRFDELFPRPELKKRDVLDHVADAALGLASGVTGLAKSATDFVDPSSRASKWLGDVSENLHGAMSEAERDTEKKRKADQRRIEADPSLSGVGKFTEEAKSAFRNMSVPQLAELVGNILPTMLATGGVGLAARGLGAGANGVRATTMGAGAVTGAVGAGGDAAGSAYEAVMNLPADKLMQAPEYQELVSRLGEAKAREALAMGAARSAQIPGTAIGAFFGPLGAEAALGKKLAGQQAGGRLATAGKEAFLSEIPEEVGTTAAGNYGTSTVDPTQRLMQGAGQAAVLAAIGGGGAGFIAGGQRDKPGSTLEDDLLSGDVPATVPKASADGRAPGADGTPMALGYDAPSGRIGMTPGVLSGGTGAMVGAGTPGFDPEEAITMAASMGGRVGGRVAEVNLRFLDSAWRTGGEKAVRELAQQTNTVGLAAREFIKALEASRVPKQLEGPDPVLALPSPESESDVMLSGSDGVAQSATNQQMMDARARSAKVWQQQQETGLTPDVIQAQAARAASQEAQEQATQADAQAAVRGDGSAAGRESGELGNVGADGQSLKHVVLQNRDREGAASIAQMQQIASNPDYNRVSISRQLGEGSPVVIDEVNLPDDQRGREEVAVDGQGRSIRTRYAVVEAADLLASHTADGQAVKGYERGEGGKMRAVAGNGRVAGIQRAYTNGRATSYRTAMQFDPLHGIDPQVIAGMQSPVLVRTMSPVDVTADIGDRTNTTGVSQLSPVEQAKNDARRVDVAGLEFDDNGDPTPDSVRRFVQGMPESERGNLMDASGQYGRQAIDRLMAAVFWKAYGDADLVQLYAQATDPEAKTVLNALADAAGPMAQLAGTAVDIRDVVAEAAKAAVNAKRKGLKLADFARTQDMTMTSDTQAVVDFFAQNIRSAKRIGEGLRSAAQFALDNQGGSDMFGDVPPASRTDVINKLRGQDDTRTTQSDADAGRAGPAQVDAGRDGQRNGQDQQGAGRGPEADSGQGQSPDPGEDLDSLFDEALTAATTPKQPAQAGFSLPENQEKDDGAQVDQTKQATPQRQEEADAPAVGPFGPVFTGLTNNPEGAIEKLMAEKKGEVVDAYIHPEIGPIAFVYGDEAMGLRHIEAKRGIKWVQRIPEILRNGRLERDPNPKLKRAYIVQQSDPSNVTVIRLDWDGQQKTWLVTAHPDDKGKWGGVGKTSSTTGNESGQVQGNPSLSSPPQNSNSDQSKAQGPAMVALQKQKAKRDAEASGLTSPTPDQIRATEEAKAAAERAEKAAKAADDARAKLEQERKEIAQRSEAAADTFELGQDAMANLTGQKDIFGGDVSLTDEGEKSIKSVRDLADKMGMEYVGGLFTNSLKKGQSFTLLGKDYTVTAVTESRIRMKSGDGKTIEALKYGGNLYSGGNRNNKPYDQFARDFEGQISVDLINENNRFHKKSEVFNLTQAAIDALPDDMKSIRDQSQPKTETKPQASSEAAPASPAIDASLQTMFEGLDGRGLKKTNAQKKLAKAGADAQYVQEHWLDILQDLEDRGVLKINCK